jgi:hypothetical protein
MSTFFFLLECRGGARAMRSGDYGLLLRKSERLVMLNFFAGLKSLVERVWLGL